MPAWNAAASVERALASVLEERAVEVECIVVDDGSTDGTADVVEAVGRRDPRVVLIRLPVNGGVSEARNRGLAIARGTWLAFHDADDRMLPGGIAALMRPTADPTVRAVVGQRIWSDGVRTWLSPLYDIPDIREPGRKSVATHPGLLYYAAVTGKAFHRSLVGDLRFAGRVLGDQAWTIRALLRAGGDIEVVEDTVFEWTRPHPDHEAETITVLARATARGAAEMAGVAATVFDEVSIEVDARIADPATRFAIKRAYLERLIRSDLSGQVSRALDRRDPETGAYFDALAAFLESVPAPLLEDSDLMIRRILWPPLRRWRSVVPDARPGYRRMVRARTRADRATSYRAAGPLRLLAIALARLLGPRSGGAVASALTASVALSRSVAVRVGQAGRRSPAAVVAGTLRPPGHRPATTRQPDARSQDEEGRRDHRSTRDA
jgi:glycosyltransferase involved in cell wall biosynthesis